MQGGAEGTEERVLALHIEMCEKGEVTSLKEGHDVERVTPPGEWNSACGATLSSVLCQLREDREEESTSRFPVTSAS